MTIAESTLLVSQGDEEASTIVSAFLDRIAQDSTNSFREVWKDEPSGEVIKAEPAKRLAGAVIAIKDNIVTKQGKTTCGSKMLEHYTSPFNATVVERLQDEGAVLIGKTNCDEFAMGSSTEHCAWGAVRNPWDLSRVPGGSSGGSAAAVAAGLCHAALGSDTGGSIRQPASFCGVVGYKPTYGLVSRYGLVAFASSLDQIGTFASTIEDVALVTDVIAGFDPHDSTSRNEPAPNLLESLHSPIKDLKIGVPSQYQGAQNSDSVNEAIERAIETYQSLGATIVEIDLPLTDVGISTYYVIAPAEASSNLARFDGIRYGHRTAKDCKDMFELYANTRAEGFGDEVKRRIMLGTYVLSSGYYDAYYKNALKARRLIRDEYKVAFEQCDVILGPTSPTPAFKIGEKVDPVSMYLCDVYTANTNIAGICGVSIPCGFEKTDDCLLPIGLHLQGPWHKDDTLLRAAQMFECATDFHLQSPGSST